MQTVWASYSGYAPKLVHLKKMYSEQLLLEAPLIIKGEKEDQKCVVLRSGPVIFWGYSPKERESFMKKHKSFFRNALSDGIEEQVNIHVGESKDTIKQGDIHVQELTVEKIALISAVLGRSVVLEYFEKRCDVIGSVFQEIIHQLRTTGKCHFNMKELIQKIAEAMDVRQNLVFQKDLLGTPDIIWDEAPLFGFYKDLSEEYEIEERFDVLQNQLDAFQQSTEFIFNMLETKKSHWLEITIVLLIVLEIIIFIFELIHL